MAVIEQLEHGLYLAKCDYCGREEYIEDCHSFNDAEWQMEAMGWTYERDGDIVKDVCPDCADEFFCAGPAEA